MAKSTIQVKGVEEYLVKYGPQPDEPGIVITKPYLEAVTPDLKGKMVKIPSTGEIGLVYNYWFDDTGLLAQIVPKQVVMDFIKKRGEFPA